MLSIFSCVIVMLSKAHLTSHSKMSGSRWVITPSRLSGSLRSFLYGSSVYSYHLFLIPSASVRPIPFFVLYWAHLCMECPLGISNFKISLFFPILLFPSILLHWSLRKAFLSFLAILLNSAFNWVIVPFLLCL